MHFSFPNHGSLAAPQLSSPMPSWTLYILEVQCSYGECVSQYPLNRCNLDNPAAETVAQCYSVCGKESLTGPP